jgi:NhaP-type Na+/H+ or K+/H+ antiporter
VAFIGWFGPRGLASVVFGLIAFDTLAGPEEQAVLPAVVATVVLSIVAHGVTASPWAARYARRATSMHKTRPEHHPTPRLRTRSEGVR